VKAVQWERLEDEVELQPTAFVVVLVGVEGRKLKSFKINRGNYWKT
jgi:hypothetical protein